MKLLVNSRAPLLPCGPTDPDPLQIHVATSPAWKQESGPGSPLTCQRAARLGASLVGRKPSSPRQPRPEKLDWSDWTLRAGNGTTISAAGCI